MILKEFYQLKRSRITSEVSYNGVSPKVFLYNNDVFRSATITNPFIMFKYDMIDWETSSERSYKADVNFCLYVVMPKKNGLADEDYQDVFDISQSIDKAVLFETSNSAFIDSNSTFKIQEKQLAYDKDDWQMADYFIWEITYKTTLIESNLKKRYHLIKNGYTDEALTERGYAPLTADVVENDGSVTSQGKYFSIEEAKLKGELYLNTKPNSEKVNSEDEESIINDAEITNQQLIDNDIKKITLNNNQA